MTTTKNDRFSIFPCGWWNEKKQKVQMRQSPQQTMTIADVYRYITSERARWATETLREMMATATDEELRKFKVLHFEYATFSGIFSYRNAQRLAERTPYITIDIDHLSSTEEARELQQVFTRDKLVETALCFVSPKGKGVKWVTILPKWLKDKTWKEQFAGIRQYVGFNYGYDPDPSGSDISRACFLPWDENCYINPKFIK